ncbi:MAG TPA: lysophospholipid acyltransferase family protein [Pyrinomonadaceae bacterium]|jgi:1-acyl-sn-glycerol-3-phosphate acyltransferase|nr:lysophospholipid acyltransferase family protein [Pyrinomonadaceae bacterium]
METTAETKDDAETPALVPTAAELGVLSPFERFAFGLTLRMNRGAWKRFWTFCQRTLGAGWIRLCTYNLMRVTGLEHVESVSRERPLLLVANHRSFFDMYVVSTVLFRRTKWRKQLFFPVRGRFFYDTIGGPLVNFVMGWWSMFPPFFAGGDNPKTEQREFDKFSMRLLAHLCREGAGNVIGFHPEGTRNKNSDPYTYLRPQPGVGKLIKDARPQVVPVFIAGLGNDLKRQVLGNWRGGEKVRVRFGPAIDFSEFYDRRDSARTYMEIAAFVMSKIAELGEQDRASAQLEAARGTVTNQKPEIESVNAPTRHS